MPEEELMAGVEDGLDAEGQELTETQVSQTQTTGEEGQAAAAGDGKDGEKVEKAFAARLAAERQKIEAQYKPHADFITREAARYNMTPAQYIEAYEAQRIKEEAEAKGVHPDVVKLQQKLERLENETQMTKAEARNQAQKAELKGKKYFDVLEKDIDKLVEENKGKVDVKTAFIYLRGEKMEELSAKEEERIRKETETKTLKDQEAKRKGKVMPGASPQVSVKPQYKSVRDALAAAAAELDDL